MSSDGVANARVSYFYDSLGRLTGKTFARNEAAVAQSYYQPGEAGAAGKIGRLKRAERTGVAATDYLGYDAMGRVLEMRQTINAAPAGAYGPAYSMSYQYFANGAVRQVTYPAAAGGVRRVVNYELDSVGRPVRVCNGACAADKVAEIVAADGKTGYAAHGAVGRMALGNGVVEANLYNSQLQWRQQTVTKAGGLNFQITLGFGGVGRNNGNVASQRIVSGGLDVTQQYTYTQRNQLDTAVETPTGGGGVNWQRGFGYDLYGNQWVSAATPADATPFLPQSSGWFDAAKDIQYSAASLGVRAWANRQLITHGIGGGSDSSLRTVQVVKGMIRIDREFGQFPMVMKSENVALETINCQS